MKISGILSPRCLGRLLAASALWLVIAGHALAESHFLDVFTTAESQKYYATAHIEVDTPTTYDPVAMEFVFDGTPDFSFDVVGRIRIWHDVFSDNYIDPLTGAAVGAPADGLHTLFLEIVKLSQITVTSSSGAHVSDVRIGDGVANGTSDNGLFSTGGAAELATDGSTADGYLNLFMEIDVDDPDIPVPGSLSPPLASSYEIGTLFNKTPLHLEALISEYPPAGIIFSMTAATQDFYAPASHPFVQALDNPALGPFQRPASDMVFARFTLADLQIVPEPSSFIIGGLALVGLIGFAWYRRRRQ